MNIKLDPALAGDAQGSVESLKVIPQGLKPCPDAS